MIRTTNTFSKLSLPKFKDALAAITAGMTGNANFTSLQTKIDALNTEATSFVALSIKAMNRDKAVILSRDASRKKITAMLHNLGYSVSAIANGDTEILVSSGYPFTQPRKPSPPLERPTAPKLTSGTNSGQIDCKVDSQTGLRSVNYYISTDPAALTADGTNAWDSYSYNKTKFTFSNLVPGRRYYIRVGLVGVKGQEVLSEVVTYIAQ
jgi:hypothetical protein